MVEAASVLIKNVTWQKSQNQKTGNTDHLSSSETPETGTKSFESYTY